MIPEHDMNELLGLFARIEAIIQKSGITGQVSQATAYRKFKRDRVTRWRQQGRIKPVKQGSRIYYDYNKLIELAHENSR